MGLLRYIFQGRWRKEDVASGIKAAAAQLDQYHDLTLPAPVDPNKNRIHLNENPHVPRNSQQN